MNEPNTNKINEAPEFAGGGLKADVTVSTTGKAGDDYTSTAVQGRRGEILEALAATVSGVIRSLAEHGEPPVLASIAVTEALKRGIAAGLELTMKDQEE